MSSRSGKYEGAGHVTIESAGAVAEGRSTPCCRLGAWGRSLIVRAHEAFFARQLAKKDLRTALSENHYPKGRIDRCPVRGEPPLSLTAEWQIMGAVFRERASFTIPVREDAFHLSLARGILGSEVATSDLFLTQDLLDSPQFHQEMRLIREADPSKVKGVIEGALAEIGSAARENRGRIASMTQFTGTLAAALVLLEQGVGLAPQIHGEIFRATLKISELRESRSPLSQSQEGELSNACQTVRAAVTELMKQECATFRRLQGLSCTDLQIRTTLASLLLHGIPTLAVHLKYLFWQLGRHPRAQEDVLHREGVQTVLGEALRMAPPVPMMMRIARYESQVKVKQYSREIFQRRVVQGERVLCSPSLAGRNPLHFENPDRFDPSREHVTAYHAWQPFGEADGSGRQQCPAFLFVHKATEQLLQTICKHFTFTSLPDKRELTLSGMWTTQIAEEVSVDFAIREER